MTTGRPREHHDVTMARAPAVKERDARELRSCATIRSTDIAPPSAVTLPLSHRARKGAERESSMATGATLRFETRPDRTEYQFGDRPLKVGDGLIRDGEDWTVVSVKAENDGTTTVILRPASKSE